MHGCHTLLFMACWYYILYCTEKCKFLVHYSCTLIALYLPPPTLTRYEMRGPLQFHQWLFFSNNLSPLMISVPFPPSPQAASPTSATHTRWPSPGTPWWSVGVDALTSRRAHRTHSTTLFTPRYSVCPRSSFSTRRMTTKVLCSRLSPLSLY